MDLKQYRYVLKIAELRNMTRAAGELYVAQPSLSHYIAKIEEELGTPLFNRNTNPISLTFAGEKYVETARMILALHDRMRHEISDIASQNKGLIRLAISHARAAFFLPYVLPEFKRKYPGVDIRTVEVRSDVVEEYVAKGECDLGILPFPISGAYDLEKNVICEEELVLVAGHLLKEGNAESGMPYVNLTECGEYPFVLLKKGHGIRTAVDILFMEHGIRKMKVFETTSNETAFRLATVGMGLGIVPESTIILARPLEKPYLYSLSKEGVRWQIGAIYRQKEYLTTAQKELIHLMKAHFSQFPLSQYNGDR